MQKLKKSFLHTSQNSFIFQRIFTLLKRKYKKPPKGLTLNLVVLYFMGIRTWSGSKGTTDDVYKRWRGIGALQQRPPRHTTRRGATCTDRTVPPSRVVIKYMRTNSTSTSSWAPPAPRSPDAGASHSRSDTRLQLTISRNRGWSNGQSERR